MTSKFAELLRQLRQGHRAKATVTASLLNISDNYLFLLETGRKLPSLKLLIKMAELFDCNQSWIFEQFLRTYLIREEEKIRQRFQKMASKKLPVLKLPPAPFEKFDRLSGRVLRPEWDSALTRIPI